MLSLLTLPRELCDEILSLVLSSRMVMPVNGTRFRSQDLGPHQVIFFPRSPGAYRPPSLPLLLTNKQLYAETILVIEREAFIIEVDVALVGMVMLWPTYRAIPPRTAVTWLKKKGYQYRSSCQRYVQRGAC